MQSGLVELPRALRLRAAASVAVGIFSLGLSATDAAAAALFVAPGGRDSGNCQTKSRPCKTIGHALSQAAASGDTIELAAGIYKENPLVSKSVSLVGAGQSATVLDGRRVASTIQTTRGRITISNLTIEHGKAALGGGIHSTAPSLTLDKVTVMQNTAAGATTPEGGGIYASAGNLTLNGSTITTNTAMGAHGAKASGPGNPGGNGGAAYGGGIFMTGGNLTLHRATVSGNRAVGGAGAAGGSIKIGTGGSGGGGGAALGGGIYIENSAFKLTLSHSVISANLAQSGPGGRAAYRPRGRAARAARRYSAASSSQPPAAGSGTQHPA
jgi:hypothetical protein